jgi:hypothetical protein
MLVRHLTDSLALACAAPAQAAARAACCETLHAAMIMHDHAVMTMQVMIMPVMIMQPWQRKLSLFSTYQHSLDPPRFRRNSPIRCSVSRPKSGA